MKQGTMDFNLANGNTNTPITSFEVQGAIHDANDLLLSDTHVVYVNRTNSARFSGVYIVTFNYGDPGKQHPSASQRHFQVSTSASKLGQQGPHASCNHSTWVTEYHVHIP